ncbi:MAG: GNAT family N-acetyltransferase [Oscillochloris sp.]|nr:GNAT family N-acetyltransferase [Oscillochloris sp.]
MYHIRTAMRDDCLDIAHTQVDSYRTAYAGLFPQPYLDHFTYAEQEQDWVDMFTTGTEDMLLVALSPEHHVVGYILARAQPEVFPGYDAEIVALHVRTSFQKRGIGTALLHQAVQHLLARGCRSVMLWTLKDHRARQWYEKLNGTLVGEKSYEVDDWTVHEVAYGWSELAMLS